jgi:DNA-binding MarR family transcriptional regulator
MTGKLVAMTTIPAEPTWLDDGEQRAWRAYLRGSRLLEAALDRDLQQHGVQLSEYEIISMLSEQPDRRLRMSTLADMVVQSRSRLTHTASRLEKRGWVQREACVGDRRGVELVLTDAGFEAITAMARVHVASVREHLLSHLTSAQFAALGAAMTSIADGVVAGGACEESRAAEPA